MMPGGRWGSWLSSGTPRLFRDAAAPRGELRRFPEAGDEHLQRGQERTQTRARHPSHVRTYVREAVLIGRKTFPVAKQPPPLACQHCVHLALGDQRVPERVVVKDARDIGPGGQYGLERPLDRRLERPPVDTMLHPRRESHLAERPAEAPAFGRRFDVADDVDLARVATPEAPLMGEANV